jgi:hypothetical protein
VKHRGNSPGILGITAWLCFSYFQQTFWKLAEVPAHTVSRGTASELPGLPALLAAPWLLSLPPWGSGSVSLGAGFVESQNNTLQKEITMWTLPWYSMPTTPSWLAGSDAHIGLRAPVPAFWCHSSMEVSPEL